MAEKLHPVHFRRKGRRFFKIAGYFLVLSAIFFTIIPAGAGIRRGLLGDVDPMYLFHQWGVRHEIPRRERTRIEEVARLINDIYQTMAEMRYIHPEGINMMPHDLDVGQCKAMGIDVRLIYLYQLLPQTDRWAAGEDLFIYGGSFPGFSGGQCREKWKGLRQANVPPPAANVPRLEPWITSLSDIYSGQPALIYDTQKDLLWPLNLTRANIDWKADTKLQDEYPENMRYASGYLPSVPATEFFSKVLNDLRTLKTTPGATGFVQIFAEEDRSYTTLKSLYRQYGWPDHFYGDAFEVARARNKAREEVMYRTRKMASDLFTSVGVAEYRLDRAIEYRKQRDDAMQREKELEIPYPADGDLTKCPRCQKVETARLLAKQALWSEKRAAKDLERQKAVYARYCPNDICELFQPEHLVVWEVEQLRYERLKIVEEEPAAYYHVLNHRLDILDAALDRAQDEANAVLGGKLAESITGDLYLLDDYCRALQNAQLSFRRQRDHLDEIARWKDEFLRNSTVTEAWIDHTIMLSREEQLLETLQTGLTEAEERVKRLNIFKQPSWRKSEPLTSLED